MIIIVNNCPAREDKDCKWLNGDPNWFHCCLDMCSAWSGQKFTIYNGLVYRVKIEMERKILHFYIQLI